MKCLGMNSLTKKEHKFGAELADSISIYCQLLGITYSVNAKLCIYKYFTKPFNSKSLKIIIENKRKETAFLFNKFLFYNI